jgi:membrane-associated phospholipid phosphatase
MTVGESAATRSAGAVQRRATDLLVAAGALVLLVLTALPVDAHKISGLERGAFRIVNDHTIIPFAVVWPLMQLGNIAVVPVATIAALIARRPRLAGELFSAGAAVYIGAKLIKRVVERGRPSRLMHDVVIRGAVPKGLGYVSGHIAVITALAVVAWPWLGRRGRIAAGCAVGVVFFSRMYVGAHLPLDMIGGAALGLAAAGVVRYAFGRPT